MINGNVSRIFCREEREALELMPRTTPLFIEGVLYRYRAGISWRDLHLIENFFAKLKQYRAIATRYDKLARNFLGAIYMAASVILLA